MTKFILLHLTPEFMLVRVKLILDNLLYKAIQMRLAMLAITLQVIPID